MSFEGIWPEAQRNVRIQLRPKRAAAAALITGAASVTAYLSFLSSRPDSAAATLEGARNLLQFLILAQATVLAVGGGIYCLQAIHREKELNTFDYQRITRLTPLELTLGKLVGAPSLMYFVVLCLFPLTLLAAWHTNAGVGTFLEIYVVLLLGSLAVHCVALLISMLTGRGTSAGAIIFFLLLMMPLLFTSYNDTDQMNQTALHNLSPYFALQLAVHPGVNDLLLGRPVPHVPVLIVLYLTFSVWFLLGLVRNIKRDPAVYEVYSPPQAFGFVLYVEVLVLLFFQWNRNTFTYARGGRLSATEVAVAPTEALHIFLAVSVGLFGLLGLALLRNRERVRRRIFRLGAAASGGWAALWPAPYLLGGLVGVGLTMAAIIEVKLRPVSDWSQGMAVFQVCFIALWIARDALYLQWMSLRRGRRPLVTGLIYLIVYYVCAAALATPLKLNGPFGACLLPWSVFSLDAAQWGTTVGLWMGSLILLGVEAAVFALLQRGQLRKLRESTVLQA